MALVTAAVLAESDSGSESALATVRVQAKAQVLGLAPVQALVEVRAPA